MTGSARVPARCVVVERAVAAGAAGRVERARGVFAGDLAVALERAGAFCRVVATGSAFEAASDEGHADDRAHRTTLRASQLLRTGEDLERCATLWREDKLD